MKKIAGLIFAVCLAATLAGCSSKPPVSGGMPHNIANARRNAPEDVLVGIGNAKMGTVAQSRNIAATRARAEISNTMDSIVKNMVRDYTASSEVDPQAALSFQENITVTLSKSNLSGSVIMNEEPDRDGQWWVVMYLSKANVTREISQAQAAARLAVPAMASFDAEQRMNDAFEQAKREGW
ncbi:MAG: hypothetical protein LBH43_07780 [Treponema sp.]|nr:hypothetical protein [Treponema sp.]